jgi:hypothetical protein
MKPSRPFGAEENAVKYLLLLIRSDEAWESLSDEERDYASIMRWWGEQAAAGHLVGGHELHPARTATTVSKVEGRPVVTDGPFMESKESIGGYGVFELPDLDAAIEIAKTFPAVDHKVEIRPLVER